MKDVTKQIIMDFDIARAHYDFMGAIVNPKEIKDLTYHHYLIRNSMGGSYSYENGVVLTRPIHDYFHTIEHYEEMLASYITSEMLDMKIKGYLDLHNIENIEEILEQFEYHYDGFYSKKGNPVVKPIYKKRILYKRG